MSEPVRRPSAIEALHPLTKLALMLAAVAAGAALPTIPAVLGVYVLVLVPLAAAGGCLAPFLRTSLRVLTPFLISLLLIQGFFTPGRRCCCASVRSATRSRVCWWACSSAPGCWSGWVRQRC